jgi:hypothetical protein
MAASALKGSGLTTYVLTFTVPASGTEVGSLGNTRPKLTTTLVEVYLEARNANGSARGGRGGIPRVQESAGVDVKELAFTGVCVDPSVLPSGVKDGSTASLTIWGRKGTFTLTLDWPSEVPEVDAVMGQPILGTWRAS